MEKMNEKETYYGILMNRIIIDCDLYLYKPISIIEGFLDNYIDYQCFSDNLGNSYNLSSDTNSLSNDEELSVNYIIKEEDLLNMYPENCLIEALNLYYESLCNKINIGFYLSNEDKMLFLQYDVLNDISSKSEEIKITENFLNKLEEIDCDEAIVIELDKFKSLLQINEYNELHNELQNIYSQIEIINEYFHIDLNNEHLQLLDKVYNYILSINDIEQMKTIINKLLDNYNSLLKNPEYNNIKCQSFLNNKISNYSNLLKYDNIDNIKKEIMIIKKEEYDNIIKIIKKSEEKPKNLINIKEMKKYVDRKVIGQEEAKKDIIQSIYMNSLSEDSKDRNNCLLIGPSGSGKTLIVETISEYLDMPMQIFDTTQLTSPGYKGEDIEDFLARLLYLTNGDLDKAEHAIVVFDEIDKKGSSDNSDVSGRGVLNTLLPFIQGTTYDIKYNNKIISFDTSKLTIFATGAFTDVIKNTKQNIMGFSSEIKQEDITYPELTIEDLVKKGNMPIELIGRFTTITQLKGHTKETLKQIILSCDNSALLKEKFKLKKIGIELKWTDSYIDAVVEKAFELKTGARSLKNILEKSVKNARWEVIENIGFYTTIVLEKDTVYDNEICKLYDFEGNVYNLKDIIKENEKIKKLERKN